MTNEEAIKILEVAKAECEWNAPLDYQEALDMATSALGAIDQYRWERDIAIEQLKELGYALGEKIRTDGDCISRQAAIDALDKIFPVDPMRNDYTQGITCGAALATEYIKQLPSVQPEHEYTMEEFMYGQDMGNPEDGSL